MTRSHVTLKGENCDGTVIGANTAVGMLNPQGEKICFYPQYSRFFEVNSQGPGAAINEGCHQLSAEQLKAFALPMIFPDWEVH